VQAEVEEEARARADEAADHGAAAAPLARDGHSLHARERDEEA
jgi:hypothetical protein